MKNNKKGFTLVELLVVIAILAILATVSIVGYTSFINNANNSVAQQELTQIRDYYLAGKYLGNVVVNQTLVEEIGLEGTIEKGTDASGNEWYKYEVRKGVAYWNMTKNTIVTTAPDVTFSSTETPKEFPWKNSSVVFVGDSITNGAYAQGEPYHKVLDDMGVFSSVTAMGVNGSCISTTSNYGNTNEPLILRYNTIPAADLIVIFMGTNDYGHNTPIGNENDMANVSFYGSLNIVVDRLQKQCPNSQLVFVTPLHRYNASYFGTPEDTTPNGKGHTLEDYVNAIKKVCQNNNIPVIDLFETFPIEPTDSSYFPDGLHPNAAGHAIVADLVYEALFDIPKKQTGDIEVEPTDPKELPSSMPLMMGNRLIGGTYLNDKARATIVSNIYLMPGDRIDYIGGSQYSWIASPATNGEFSGGSGGTAYVTPGDTWSQSSWIVAEEGWYVFTFKKESNFDFSEGGDPNDFFDYISITRNETTSLQLQIGMKFLANTQQNRASTNKNLYLEEGTVITYKSGYNFAVYATTSEWSTTQTSGTSWITSYKIPVSGYYGISVKKIGEANFDFDNADSTDLYDYVTIE